MGGQRICQVCELRRVYNNPTLSFLGTNRHLSIVEKEGGYDSKKAQVKPSKPPRYNRFQSKGESIADVKGVELGEESSRQSTLLS